MAIGAVEEFLDLQLQDAMDEVARVEKALEDAGVPKESIQAGPKELLDVYKRQDLKRLKSVFGITGISRKFEVYFCKSDNFWDR